MQKYKLLNNIFGWVSFVFAAVVYGMTMESTGSFWDCGEFISGCFKLQVVHPPGAPFFLMLGRIFTLFSGGDPLVNGTGGNVGVSINLMSALATAGSVMFTFWTVTALARKFVIKDNNYTSGAIVTVIGAGLIAAGCCTFLDSLWFSAVEGEVYALSQFFMSLIFWAIMKWDADDSKYADHWLVLISYMTGLSIGVHLLSLLALPAIAMVYYYKKYKTTLTGWVITGAVGFLILGLYMKFIISFTQSYLAGMDLFFVNTVGAPFNSGVVFGLLLLLAVIAVILRYTHTGTERDFRIAVVVTGIYAIMGLIITDSWTARFIRFAIVGTLFAVHHYGYEARRLMNIGILSVAFSYIGYMSYIMVPIRAIANPPINMNRPTDPFTIKSYVDREQYGDRPLLKGPDYTCTSYDIEDYIKTGERWVKDEAQGKYVYGGDKQDYKIRDDVQMPFPRLGFWQEEGKIAAYRAWLNPEYNVIDRATKNVVKTFPPSGLKQANEYAASLNKESGQGQYAVKDAITFKDNLAFFFKYQIGYMYFRYFFWNFAGRQNDIQGTYGNDDGRWISGIPFIDNSHKFFTPEWPQENLSKSMMANKARNKFFMIPFILGLIGLIYTLFKDERTFWIILVLFGTTGFLQIVYQNEPPIEPRERDYAIASSFLTFTMWIGFGLIALVDLFRNKFKLPELPSAIGALVLCAAAPFLMGSQGWDDHTRHDRYPARDFAIDYLESCAPNAVIFTQGDNDTYPLWYAQETEGVRPDIRIINLSLLGVDWYIEQLNYKTNNAAPLKMSFKPSQYEGRKRDVTRFKQDSRIGAEGADLRNVMKFIASEDQRDKVMYQNGESENYLPTKTFYLDIDTDKAKAMNMLSPDDQGQMVSRMQWTIDNNALLKNDLLTLDIVANNIMERPIYFAVSVAPEAYMGLEKYFQLEGLTYRVVPKVNASNSPYSSPVRTDVMYENMMKKFKFAGIAENPHVYLDENTLRMTVNIRGNFGRLAQALLDKGEKDKAAAVIDYSLKVMPADRVPHSVFDYSYPEVYYEAGQKEKARALLNEMLDKAKDELNYYKTVYKFALNQAQDAGDMAYYSQLQQGAFMERREVREQLFIMQELTLASKKYDDADYSAKIDEIFQGYRMSFVQMPK
ncbi:MAG TPA: DUF2723 domain-containing protein [Chitinophagales bacterium]|nr:DUF2723 domain-containing protein [Chitinophagales bacterium]